MPKQQNLPGLAEYLKKKSLVIGGVYIHSCLSCDTTSYVEQCLKSPKKNGNIWDRLNGALDDPLIVNLIDAEGRDIVRTAFAMAIRRHRAIQFVEEAGKEFARDHLRVDRLTESHKIYVSRNRYRNKNTLDKITAGLVRAARLETIIGEMETAAGVLDRHNGWPDTGEYKEFGRIPEGLVQSMNEDFGLGALRRRMEYADKVVARLYADFPSLMAELPSNLLLAEGPEGQPARSTRAVRGRCVMLRHEKPA